MTDQVFLMETPGIVHLRAKRFQINPSMIAAHQRTIRLCKEFKMPGIDEPIEIKSSYSEEYKYWCRIIRIIHIEPSAFGLTDQNRRP